MHRIHRDQLIYAFSADIPPVLTVDPGERVIVETYDASTGRIHRPEDLAAYLDVRDPYRVNPAGGPINVRGSAPGDEVIVTIERIGLASQGYVRAMPGGPVLPDVAGPLAVVVAVDGHDLVFPGGLRWPTRPMVGVIGTAPAHGVVYTAHPGPQGSNLDCNAIRVGARVHLPVHVPGALLAIGDVHASMGDGEVSGTGVEINGEVQVTIDLQRGGAQPRPWIEVDGQIVATGSAPTLQQAVAIAVDGLVRLLRERYALDRTQAFLLISARGDVHVGQCCGGLDATAYASFTV